ncbi:unnamed protein product [Phytomonas sp. Hart1]|nr:unnamed protein product [Phytomonas sp. Hart1]|eukprot:CCW71982.1 unnamed protein product [Phytomonas sp. isolate Hart1]
MFSCSRVGQVVRLVSLSLVEAPAVGTVSLNLHLSRTNPGQSYGFKIKADTANTMANSDPLLSPSPPSSSLSTSVRYRLIEIPRFLTASSRAVGAFFPPSHGGTVYLNAVNGRTATYADGMIHALMEGKNHVVELCVEGMSLPDKPRGRKSTDEGSTHSEEGVEARSERLPNARLGKTDRKRIPRAKNELKSRRSRQAAPTEVTEKEDTTTLHDIDTRIAKITADMANPSSNTDASAVVDDAHFVTKPPKRGRGRPSKRQSVGEKEEAEAEGNVPSAIISKDTVDPHKTSPDEGFINAEDEDRKGNPLIDSTAAIIQLTQRLSTLTLPSESATAELNSKDKQRSKKKTIDQPLEEDEAWFGNLGTNRDESKKHAKHLKKTKNSRASAAALNDKNRGLDDTVSDDSDSLNSTKGHILVADGKDPDRGLFTMEL